MPKDIVKTILRKKLAWGSAVIVLGAPTEDGKVTLLLTDRVVAFQLSDRTMRKIDRELHRSRHEGDDEREHQPLAGGPGARHASHRNPPSIMIVRWMVQ